MAIPGSSRIWTDGLRDGFVETDSEGIIVSANPAFIHALGFEAESEVTGRNIRIFPEKRHAQRLIRAHQSVIDTGLPSDYFQVVFRGKNGQSFVGELAISPCADTGHRARNLMVIRNVTHRFEAERTMAYQKDFLEALLQQSPVAIATVDKTGHISLVNPAFQKLFACSAEEAEGKGLDRFLSPSRILKRLERYYAQHTHHLLRVSPYHLKKDGSKIELELHIQPFFAGSINYGHLVFCTDVTQRNRAERLMESARNDAESRARQLAALNRLAQQVSRSLDLNQVMEAACRELVQIFPVANATLWLLDRKYSQLEVRASHSIFATTGDPREQGIRMDKQTMHDFQRLFGEKKPEVIPAGFTSPLPETLQLLAGFRDSRAVMLLPLVVSGETRGCISMTHKETGALFDADQAALAGTVAGQVASALDNAHLYARTERALGQVERDLEIGREIQTGFFPHTLPTVAGYDMSTYFRAARQVSGDFYDLFPAGENGQMVLAVADVCDKGVGAALFMVLLRTLIRSGIQLSGGMDPGENLERTVRGANSYVVSHHGRSNMFATLFLGILEPDRGRLHYISAGHEPALVISSEGTVRHELIPTGPAIGFTNELPFEVRALTLQPGDILFSFTDGFSEARDADCAMYTGGRFICEAAQHWTSAFSAVKHLEMDVFSHMGDQVQLDDLTLVALRRGINNEIPCHRMTRRAVMKNLSLFRHFVEASCQCFQVDSEITESLRLATDEICTNIIQYGYRDRAAGDIVLSVEQHPGEIRIEVQDRGQYFHPASAAEPELDNDLFSRKTGGLGIYMARQLADEVTYSSEDGTNRLTMKKKYTHPTQQA